MEHKGGHRSEVMTGWHATGVCEKEAFCYIRSLEKKVRAFAYNRKRQVGIASSNDVLHLAMDLLKSFIGLRAPSDPRVSHYRPLSGILMSEFNTKPLSTLADVML